MQMSFSRLVRHRVHPDWDDPPPVPAVAGYLHVGLQGLALRKYLQGGQPVQLLVALGCSLVS